ncbi:MAG: hypothetical protein J0M28_08615 [Thauera sp.]|nr:hypothetical protein [Thauera sp.]
MHRLCFANGIPCVRGQSLVELLVVTFILVGIFAMPFEGYPSLAALFTDAIGAGYDRFQSALVLPI